MSDWLTIGCIFLGGFILFKYVEFFSRANEKTELTEEEQDWCDKIQTMLEREIVIKNAMQNAREEVEKKRIVLQEADNDVQKALQDAMNDGIM
jgi:hypothetical protein